jgi:hypothetical protein
MDPRIFEVAFRVWTTDGNHSETFNRGERVKNVARIGRGVVFEPVDPRHVAATYTMNWDEFVAVTSAVRPANA